FEMWFWLGREPDDGPGGHGHIDPHDLGPIIAGPGHVDPGDPVIVTPGIFRVEGFAGRTVGFVERRAIEAGITLNMIEEAAPPDVRRNTVLGTDAPAGSELRPGQVLTVRVARGAGG